MSGGVDSSTAAVLLQEEGFDLVGCTMQLWDYRRNPPKNGEVQFGRCCSLDDVYDARRVAEALGFPFYVLNLEKEFEETVISPFIAEYLAGRTPLPCTHCNTVLKFDRLLQFARQVDIERVATGHYARIEHARGEGYRLLKGLDPGKDQSYFLFELSQRHLPFIEFPVGSFHKEEIRRLAEQNGLVTAGKKDSQEICFVPDRDYPSFIRRHAPEIDEEFLPVLGQQDRPGPILFRDGTRLGTHPGVYHFTVGQRRGLGVAHPRPLYVLRLDVARNAVIVGYCEDLFSSGLTASRVNWVAGEPPAEPVEVEVKIRARHRAAPATVEFQRDANGNGGKSWTARVTFGSPQRSVTPGQAAVFYSGDVMLGGGWIDSRLA